MDPHSQTVRWLANMFEDQFFGGEEKFGGAGRDRTGA